MKTNHLLLIYVSFIIFSYSSNLSAQSNLNDILLHPEVKVIGWLWLSGEIKIYVDRKSMLGPGKVSHAGETAPPPDNKCISGVYKNHYKRLQGLKQYDGRKVVVTGDLVLFESLPEEDEILHRKLLEGSIIENWCYGNVVLLAKSIEYARK